MKYRDLRGSGVKVSEVGFGLWTVSTGWWGTGTAAGLARLKTDRMGSSVAAYFGREPEGAGFKGTTELRQETASA